MIPEYESLTASLYQLNMPNDKAFRAELEIPEGAELHHGLLGTFSTVGVTLAEAARRMILALYRLGYRGELIFANHDQTTEYIISDLSKDEHTSKVFFGVIDRHFPHAVRTRPEDLSINTMEDGAGEEAVEAFKATPRDPAKQPLVHEGQLMFGQNTTGERFVFYEPFQTKEVIDRLSMWMEEQGGLSCHLAGMLMIEGARETILTADTTYTAIKSAMWDPNRDVSEFVVGDDSNDTDLLVSVKAIPHK